MYAMEVGDWHEGVGISCEDCHFASLFDYAEDCDKNTR